MSDEIDALTLDELRQGFRTMVDLTQRLANANDADTRVTIVRLLTSLDPGEPLPDIAAMVDRVLDERDEYRRRLTLATDRLRRLSVESATLSILEGKA